MAKKEKLLALDAVEPLELETLTESLVPEGLELVKVSTRTLQKIEGNAVLPGSVVLLPDGYIEVRDVIGCTYKLSTGEYDAKLAKEAV